MAPTIQEKDNDSVNNINTNNSFLIPIENLQSTNQYDSNILLPLENNYLSIPYMNTATVANIIDIPIKNLIDEKNVIYNENISNKQNIKKMLKLILATILASLLICIIGIICVYIFLLINNL